MVLLQYYNLLLHKDGDTFHIIGEDMAIDINSRVNPSLPQDSSEEAEYTSHFIGVTRLVCAHKSLRSLPPPATGYLDSLVDIDLSHCTNVTRIPSAYGVKSTVQKLNISLTKVSALPLSFMSSLKSLDVSGCRRITNVGDMSQLCVLNITNSTVVDLSPTTCAHLQQLIALHSKLTKIETAPELKIILWSGTINAQLNISDCGNLISIITSGACDRISVSGSSPYISSLGNAT